MSQSSPNITVIIPVFNGLNFLSKCLDGIFSSTYRSFEVLVVDDCSTDGSGVLALEKGARVMLTKSRSGPGAARNLAAEVAAGEILLFVDADVVVNPTTLEQIAKRFEDLPEISALFGSYDDDPAERNFLSQYKNLQHHFVHQHSCRQASTFWSGLGAMRRSVFLEHGGFDHAKFSEPSIEDIDLGSRLRSNGKLILLDPDIQAKHFKKWGIRSHLRTEIFCRAIPWSTLILEKQVLINDMNLKWSDRISSALAGLSLVCIVLAFWQPLFCIAGIFCLVAIALMNAKILKFFARKRGIPFAIMSFPWQVLYFFYSGTTFAICWFWFSLTRALGVRKHNDVVECPDTGNYR